MGGEVVYRDVRRHWYLSGRRFTAPN